MAHGENGTPKAPDWFHDPALERCIGCNKARVACEADCHFGETCCGFCSHGLHPARPPVLWDGDQA